jgi:hypothetical protein
MCRNPPNANRHCSTQPRDPQALDGFKLAFKQTYSPGLPIPPSHVIIDALSCNDAALVLDGRPAAAAAPPSTPTSSLSDSGRRRVLGAGGKPGDDSSAQELLKKLEEAARAAAAGAGAGSSPPAAGRGAAAANLTTTFLVVLPHGAWKAHGLRDVARLEPSPTLVISTPSPVLRNCCAAHNLPVGMHPFVRCAHACIPKASPTARIELLSGVQSASP